MKITAQNLTVSIWVDAWQAIDHWIRMADGWEVSGLGLVEEERDEDDVLTGYVVTHAFLPEQVNGRSSTELDPDSVARLMLDVENSYGASERLRFWWHHHPGGIGLMWSHTDEECVEELRNGDWFVSAVFDPQMDCRTRIDYYAPLRLTVDQVPTKLRFTDFGLAAQCEEQFKERVKHRQSTKKKGHGPSAIKTLRSSPRRGRHMTAEELLLAQEEVESGEMSYAHYLELVDDSGVLLDDGWFGEDVQPGIEDIEGMDGEEVAP